MNFTAQTSHGCHESSTQHVEEDVDGSTSLGLVKDLVVDLEHNLRNSNLMANPKSSAAVPNLATCSMHVDNIDQVILALYCMQ